MYDYIIVGGGSAGCVLANRLSASGQWQVCLIEAGPRDTNPFIRLPNGIIFLMRSKSLNWNFWTSPQVHCKNRRLYCPRGRTLGGSSALNAMCYIRGNPHDFNEWEKLGNEGWSYADVFPYFKKIEHFEPGENQYHGIDGPLNVTTARYINPLMKVFVEAGMQAGYPLNDDFNGQTQEGVGYYHVTQKKGQRWSNAHAYLHQIEKRKNLTVLSNAQATQILFKGKQAVGIRYYANKRYIEIFANKEILLTAGVIGSPQLLLLSGVGASAELNKHHIPIVHELPGVGENFQDHLDIAVTCLEKTRHALNIGSKSLFHHLSNLFQYFVGRKGELSSNLVQAGGFIKSNQSLALPDLQWHFLPFIYKQHGHDLRLTAKYYAFMLRICFLHPKSRGRITLKNSDPFSAPIIDPNYLGNPQDLDKLVIALKKSRLLLSQPAFLPHLLNEFEPGDEVQSDEEIKDYIRANAESIYHPVGTCKMGIDSMAVVNPQLKVHGVTSLRVIDASVMPIITTGNTNAATTMIAEKGADLILT